MGWVVIISLRLIIVVSAPLNIDEGYAETTRAALTEVNHTATLSEGLDHDGRA